MIASSIAICRAGPPELDALTALFNAYREFQGQAGDSAAARDFLRARLERSDSAIFLARQGRAPAGFAQLYPSYSSVALARTFVLNDLYVEPASRRQGVAARLLAAAEAYAWSRGAVRVTLNVAKNNDAGHELYEAQGWVRDQAFDMYHRYPPRVPEG